jgi:hypothetical protein
MGQRENYIPILCYIILVQSFLIIFRYFVIYHISITWSSGFPIIEDEMTKECTATQTPQMKGIF